MRTTSFIPFHGSKFGFLLLVPYLHHLSIDIIQLYYMLKLDNFNLLQRANRVDVGGQPAPGSHPPWPPRQRVRRAQVIICQEIRKFFPSSFVDIIDVKSGERVASQPTFVIW